VVYVETPNGFLEQPAAPQNIAQRHLSGWFPHDFESRGYSVFGSSHKYLRGSQGAARYFSEPVTRALERSIQWAMFRQPRSAHTITAIRYIDTAGDLRRM
jgi:hypothetical protein